MSLCVAYFDRCVYLLVSALGMRCNCLHAITLLITTCFVNNTSLRFFTVAAVKVMDV
jgi:hypothetical protein